jgi:hypothetical protein
MLERLELVRLARIVEAPRTCSERAHAFQEDVMNDMPSLEQVDLSAICEPASYLRAMKSLEKPMWEATI